jgi:threonine aldolase
MVCVIDLRSDTKTLPTPEMLATVTQAPLGDDVAGEDPTVNALEAHCAQLLGKQAAVLVTGGTMGNLASIYSQIRPGEELICHRQAHIYHYERGGMSAVCGALVRPIGGEKGALDLDELADTLAEGDLHRQRTGLVCLENTHNNCGGTVLSAEHTAQVAAIAREYGVGVHIDGARIFNAAVALGVDVASLADPADSVTFCFSKSLGAPVGAMIVGSEELMKKVREARKLFGGGMRQAGVIAAMALYSLEHNISRLADDHRHATEIARTLAELRGIEVDLATVESNMVYFSVLRDDINAPGLCERLGEYGIKAGARNDHLIRFVTHLDIDDAGCARVCDALRAVLG